MERKCEACGRELSWLDIEHFRTKCRTCRVQNQLRLPVGDVNWIPSSLALKIDRIIDDGTKRLEKLLSDEQENENTNGSGI